MQSYILLCLLDEAHKQIMEEFGRAVRNSDQVAKEMWWEGHVRLLHVLQYLGRQDGR